MLKSPILAKYFITFASILSLLLSSICPIYCLHTSLTAILSPVLVKMLDLRDCIEDAEKSNPGQKFPGLLARIHQTSHNTGQKEE